MCVRLDLLAEGSGRRFEVGSWLEGVVQIESKIPSAYHAVSAAGISVSLSTHWAPLRQYAYLRGTRGLQYGVVGIDGQTVDA
jgi:hypothetical protein